MQWLSWVVLVVVLVALCALWDLIFCGGRWTCPGFVDTWVKLPMPRDPTVARRPGG